MNEPAWEDGNWTPLSALRGDVDADVCVIGLGGSGLTCIGELLRLGQRVVGLDVGVVGGGAAGRNGGFLLAGLPSFYHSVVAALGRERAAAAYRLTLAELDRMTGETPEAIRRVGSLRIAADDVEFADCDAQFEAMRAAALPVERYLGPEGRGLLVPTDGAFDPLLRCRLLARAATTGGARLFEQSAAVEISGNRVRTPEGSVRVRKVIVAVDGRLEAALPELEGRVRTARLQMIGTAPAKDVSFLRPVYRRWGYDYWQQLPDGRVVLGGLRDRHVDAEWTNSGTPTAEFQAALEELLRRDVGTVAPVTHHWAATVGYTPNGFPVVSEVRPGVLAIGGYNGTGNVIGALCGRAVAQLAVSGATTLLDPLGGPR